GRTFRRVHFKSTSQLCVGYHQRFSLHRRFQFLHPSSNPSHPRRNAVSQTSLSLFPTFPELSNVGSFSGRAGGFLFGLKLVATSSRSELNAIKSDGIGVVVGIHQRHRDDRRIARQQHLPACQIRRGPQRVVR